MEVRLEEDAAERAKELRNASLLYKSKEGIGFVCVPASHGEADVEDEYSFVEGCWEERKLRDATRGCTMLRQAPDKNLKTLSPRDQVNLLYSCFQESI